MSGLTLFLSERAKLTLTLHTQVSSLFYTKEKFLFASKYSILCCRNFFFKSKLELFSLKICKKNYTNDLLVYLKCTALWAASFNNLGLHQWDPLVPSRTCTFCTFKTSNIAAKWQLFWPRNSLFFLVKESIVLGCVVKSVVFLI